MCEYFGSYNAKFCNVQVNNLVHNLAQFLLFLGCCEQIILFISCTCQNVLDKLKHVHFISQSWLNNIMICFRVHQFVKDNSSNNTTRLRIHREYQLHRVKSPNESLWCIIEYFRRVKLSRLISCHEESQFTRVTLHVLTKPSLFSDQQI